MPKIMISNECADYLVRTSNIQQRMQKIIVSAAHSCNLAELSGVIPRATFYYEAINTVNPK